MGFWSRFLGIDSHDPAQRVLPEPYEPFVSTGGIPVMDPGTPLSYWLGGTADAAHFWRTQPNVRKVIGFAARNVASIPLHVHERVSDTDRRRVTDGPLADVIASPRPRIGAYRFWESVISDGLLYDRWGVLKRIEDDGSVALSRVPSWRLRFTEDVLGEVEAAWFWTDKEWVELDLDDLIFDYGYAPKCAGLSPVETLSDLLDETAEAVEYRRQVWANGARAPQWVSRPKMEKEADWTPEQRERFAKGMRAYMKEGAKAGGVPLLEDGMRLEDGTRMPSKEMLDLEGRMLSAVEVASAWHIAPELIGAREGNYSNVDAYRQNLYRDSLGPYITAWEQAINVGLTPDLADGRALYVEANVEAKLRGSFLEQAKVMQSATGAPWMTRNEARSLQNRPPIDGGNELVVPLNVLVGGQASPQDSGTQNERSAPADARLKARAPETHEEQYRRVLAAFFRRQGASVLSAIGAGSEKWWDEVRWNRELTEDLHRLSLVTSEAAAKAALESLGFDPADYDQGQTINFLAAVAERQAGAINASTKTDLDEALTEDEPTEAVAHQFEVAEESRAAQLAVTSVTFASGFAVIEAGKQIGAKTKTWNAAGGATSRHTRYDGETVPIGADFSIGAPWPGDGSLDVGETANCKCSVTINPA